MSGFIHWLSLVLLVVSSSALISPTTLPRNHRRRSLQREAPKAFFGSLFPNPEADQRLDDIVKRSKAVLLSDGSAASTATKDSLKAAKVQLPCFPYHEGDAGRKLHRGPARPRGEHSPLMSNWTELHAGRFECSHRSSSKTCRDAASNFDCRWGCMVRSQSYVMNLNAANRYSIVSASST